MKDFTHQLMWSSLSLADWQYKHFHNTIENFLDDVNNLILIQDSGHVPLILSKQKNLTYHIVISHGTLEVLTKIDSSFALFNVDVIKETIHSSMIDSYHVLLGNKESFDIFINKSRKRERLEAIC